MNDPFVDEVRAARMKHTQKFNGNLKLICEDLRRIQREFPDRIVRGQPNRIVPTKPSTEHADARQTG